MSQPSRRRSLTIIVVVIILLVLLLLVRCQRKKPAVPEPAPTTTAVTPSAQTAPPAPGAKLPDEILTPATLQFPPEVKAGKPFSVKWTGPDNRDDYITVIRKDSADAVYGNYRDTREGNPVELLAPIEPGEWEVRYVTARSHTVLARAPLNVAADTITLEAPAEVVAGTGAAVTWTGPDNAGDYLTIVPKDLPDGQYGNYTNTSKGSPLTITAPITPGDAELRYMSGQGAKVLQRFPIRVVAAEVTLSAPATARAGSKVTVTWTGPNNAGDYITLVPQSLPDGQYASYANTTADSTVTIVALKAPGLAEIRYMSGQGAKVLKRIPIVITP
ncbi:MAG TPA: hypothetical protein VIM71_06805 [Lacunisphaera sp.]